jgi:hypothetical protein
MKRFEALEGSRHGTERLARALPGPARRDQAPHQPVGGQGGCCRSGSRCREAAPRDFDRAYAQRTGVRRPVAATLARATLRCLGTLRSFATTRAGLQAARRRCHADRRQFRICRGRRDRGLGRASVASSAAGSITLAGQRKSRGTDQGTGSGRGLVVANAAFVGADAG